MGKGWRRALAMVLGVPVAVAALIILVLMMGVCAMFEDGEE